MRVGIGLPNSVPGTEARLLLEWARRAEEGSFASLGVVDRMRYDSHEPMALLSTVAAITSRIDLVTMVVIAPLRRTPTFAREAATVQRLSQGRLTLGLAVGARTDDYDALGEEHEGRGRRLEDQLADLRDGFEELERGMGSAIPQKARGMGSAIPQKATGPDLLVGGGSDISFVRAARFADGYVHGGGPPRSFHRAGDRATTAWVEAGRPGRPKLWAQAYFALGDDATIERGRSYMRDYYAFTGPFAAKITEGLLTTPQSIVQFVRGYAEAGCDHLVLLPAVAELEQHDRLAAVVSS
ncbi:MAG TPA: LLM class flavin-dependent oxidoreductase [Actinomycetota bacterium]|nr:LLM class flavin-dependent oxidoreductase [Actinomycetota bacterium]